MMLTSAGVNGEQLGHGSVTDGVRHLAERTAIVVNGRHRGESRARFRVLLDSEQTTRSSTHLSHCRKRHQQVGSHCVYADHALH